ncbi:mismatch-specific DNA-glycosylase [Rhizobium sp. TH2]|nr:mismatch-specific DNA-glycosylase [Rhizobium sp. TH2]
MIHILEDLLRPNLRLVICGTAAGTRSARIGAYYAGPGNKFWRTIHVIGLTPHLVAPEDWRLLDAFGIGFTDMAKHHFGMDKDLPADCFDAGRLRAAMEEIQPGALAFNGKAAAQAFFDRKSIDYGQHEESIGKTAIWVLPSTSGAASGAWRIGPWQELADAVRATVAS